MKKIPAFMTLTIITLIAAALLAITDSITREPISLAAIAVSDAARLAVLPAATSFEQVESAVDVDALYVGSAGGQVIGHTAAITVQGYGGEVELTVGMDVQGVLTGLSVGGSNFAETAGLGSKAKEPEFTSQFIGKTVPVALGESIDAISGATITSRAVVEGVNRAAKAMGADVPAQPDMSDASTPEKNGASHLTIDGPTFSETSRQFK